MPQSFSWARRIVRGGPQRSCTPVQLGRPTLVTAGCGATGIRTPDTRLAKAVLYQLSYGPVRVPDLTGSWGYSAPTGSARVASIHRSSSARAARSRR